MKNLLPGFILLFLALSSCRKNSTNIENSNHALNGNWELRYYEGGFGPIGPSYFPPGNGIRIAITDSTIEKTSINGVVVRNTYTKTRGFCDQTHRDMDAMIIQNTNLFYEFSRDTLIIYMGMVAADGTVEKYVPVR